MAPHPGIQSKLKSRCSQRSSQTFKTRSKTNQMKIKKKLSCKRSKSPDNEEPPKKKKKIEQRAVKRGYRTISKKPDNVKSSIVSKEKQMKNESNKSTKKVNKKKSNTEKCHICGQLGNNPDLVYQGHPQYAVKEHIALAKEYLVVYSDGNLMERPQINITGFSIYDKEGHLCPPDSNLVINNRSIYISGYLNPICSDKLDVDEESIPVKDIGPFTELLIHGFRDGNKNCITISTICADYNLQNPSEQYKPLMDSHNEKIRISEAVMEYLQRHYHLKPSYKDLLENIRRNSTLELTDTKMTEELLHKHAYFVCEQVNHLKENEDNNKLITLPCMKKLIKLTGTKLDKTNTPTKIKKIRKTKRRAWTKATTTPLVRKPFENFFSKQLDKTNQGLVSQRCGICKACQLPDCGVCKACKAMPKFGGHGRTKRTCVRRICPNMPDNQAEESDEEDPEAVLLKKIKEYYKSVGYTKLIWIGKPVQIDERKVYYDKVEVNDIRLCNGDYVMLETSLPHVPSLVARIVYMWKEVYFHPGEGFFHGEIFIRSSDTILGEVGNPREVFLHDRCCHGISLSAILRKAYVKKKEVRTDQFNFNKEMAEHYMDDDGKTYFYSKFYNRFRARFEDLPEDPTCPNEFRKHRFCPTCERQTTKDLKVIPTVTGEKILKSPLVPKDNTEWSAIRWKDYDYKKGCAVFLKCGTFKLKNWLKNGRPAQMQLKPKNISPTKNILKSKNQMTLQKILKLKNKISTRKILNLKKNEYFQKILKLKRNRFLKKKNSTNKKKASIKQKPNTKKSTQRTLMPNGKNSTKKIVKQKNGKSTKKTPRSNEKTLKPKKTISEKKLKPKEKICIVNKVKQEKKRALRKQKPKKKSSTQKLHKQKDKNSTDKALKQKNRKSNKKLLKPRHTISTGKVMKSKNIKASQKILKLRDISSIQKILYQKNKHIQKPKNISFTHKKRKRDETTKKKSMQENSAKNKNTSSKKPKPKDKKTNQEKSKSKKKISTEIKVKQENNITPKKQKPKKNISTKKKRKRSTQKVLEQKNKKYTEKILKLRNKISTGKVTKLKNIRASQKIIKLKNISSIQKILKQKNKESGKDILKQKNMNSSHKKIKQGNSKNGTTTPKKLKPKNHRSTQKNQIQENSSKNKSTTLKKPKANDNRILKNLKQENSSKHKITNPKIPTSKDKRNKQMKQTQENRSKNKNTTPKKPKPKQVDEDVYTEYYRKRYKYMCGSNVYTREPFCVGYIEAVSTTGYGKLLPPQDYYLTVKIMYRPENTRNKYPHRENLNVVYWSDDVRHVPFSAVAGPCHLVYAKNVPQGKSLREWLDEDTNRFYFRHAYNKAAKCLEKVPSHATTVGRIEDRKEFTETSFTSDCAEEKVRPLRTLDVFAGCGGLSEGLHRAGIAECHWAIENSEMDALAYSLNNKNCTVFTDDCNALLRDVMAGAKYRGGLKLPMRGDVEMLVGGPPCQGFSGMNRFTSRDASSFKNSLVASFLSYCDYYRPAYFVLENVRDFVAFKRGMVLKLTMRALHDMGYQCTFGVLQAGHYGVPQARRRLILVAAAPGYVLPVFPEPTHAFSLKAISLDVMVDMKSFTTNIKWATSAPRRTVTVRDAISDLPDISNGANRGVMDYRSEPLSHYQRTARRYTTKLRYQVCKKMAPLVQARIDRIPPTPGSDWRDLPNISVELSDGTKTNVLQYRHEDIRNGRSSTGALRGVCACASGLRCSPEEKQSNTLIPWFLPHTANRHAQWAGVYGRIFWGGYFSTVITDPEPTGKQGRVLHPSQPRVVTVRECARAQGFPDHYVFAGSVQDMYRQIGNAVPPPLAEAVGREIKKSILARKSI